MINNFNFTIKTDVFFGVESLLKVEEIISKNQFTSVGVLLDGVLSNHIYLKKTLELLMQKSLIKHVFEINARAEPTYELLDELKPQFVQHNFDCLIGIGGGTVLDLTKGIATLLQNEGPALIYRGFPDLKYKPLSVIAVPTTAGTGSEVTYNAVFISAKENVKLGINSKYNYPIAAILDPLIIVGSPKSVMVSSGMDALVHTFESFASKKTNTYSRMFAKEAFKLLFPNLLKLVDERDNVEVCGNLFLGSHYAGAALMNSSAGITGAMSYPFGVKFRVPHGMAGAVFLPHIIRMTVEKGYFEYAEFYDLLPSADLSLSVQEKSIRLVNELQKLCDALEVPMSLKKYGVTLENYEVIADETYTGLIKAVENHPVEISREEIKEMLKRMLF